MVLSFSSIRLPWFGGLVGNIRQLVAFSVDKQLCAVPIDAVREVVRPMPVSPLPHAADNIVGVVDHRGFVVPIVDMQALFGRGKHTKTKKTKWVLLSAGQRIVGIAVDTVFGVIHASESALRRVPVWAEAQLAAGLGEVLSWNDRLVFVLNTSALAEPVQHLPTPAFVEENLP